MLGYLSKLAIMGFIIVLKSMAPLSSAMRCCIDNEHLGVEVRVGVNFIRAVNVD